MMRCVASPPALRCIAWGRSVFTRATPSLLFPIIPLQGRKMRPPRPGKQTEKQKAPIPWSYEETNDKGKTKLDEIYEATAQRTRELLSQISTETADTLQERIPDFLIGLGQYIFRLRDQYRFALCTAMGLPSISHVELSVAWRGRYEMELLEGSHKVLGVFVHDADSNTSQMQPLERRERVEAVIEQINSQRTDAFLSLNIIKAAPPMSSIRSKSLDPRVQKLVDRIRHMSQQYRVLILCDSSTQHEEITHWRPLFYRCHVIPNVVNVEVGGELEFPDEFDAEKKRRLCVNAIDVLSAGNGELPALFINGVHAGSSRQLHILSIHHRVLKKLVDAAPDVSIRPKKTHMGQKFDL